MKCDKCGTEYDNTPTEHTRPEFGVHTPWACRDSLKAQLAIMTKRAQEIGKLHRDEVNRLIDGLHDLSVAKDDAEAKLATAVEALQKAARWADDNKIFYHHVGGPGCASDVLHEIGKAALNTLRALGIDPSKETP